MVTTETDAQPCPKINCTRKNSTEYMNYNARNLNYKNIVLRLSVVDLFLEFGK